MLGDDEFACLELFAAWRTGNGAPGHLPFSGGAAEQPAGLMRCLQIMAGAAAALERKPNPTGA